MELTYEERAVEAVTAAIALLDKHGPENWRDRIDLTRLNMWSWRDCILGQVYEDETPDGHEGAWSWALDHLRDLVGASTDDDPDFGDAFASYGNEWKRQLGGGS